MRKLLCLLSASAVAVTLLSTNAMAWGGCGHGFHRTYYGQCVSNYGATFRLPIRLPSRLERPRLRG